MVWSQYVEEARTTETHLSDSDEDDTLPRNRPLEYDDWITWYSDDLMNLWMSMKTYREDTGNEFYLLDKMQWPDFCEFCYKFSCKLSS